MSPIETPLAMAVTVACTHTVPIFVYLCTVFVLGRNGLSLNVKSEMIFTFESKARAPESAET